MDVGETSYAQTAFDTWSGSPYFALAQQTAQDRGIDPSFFTAMIGAESGYNPNAVNGGASGIAQFMLPTAQHYGVNRNDPVSSITGAANYFNDLLQQCNGDYVCASTHYGTLPSSCKYGDCPTLTQNQQLVLQAAQKANGNNADVTCTYLGDVAGTFCTSNTVAGLNSSKMQAANAAAQNNCSSWDVVCNAKNWVKDSGANALTIVAGIVVLVIGIVMLRDSSGILPAAQKVTIGSMKKVAGAIAG